MENNRLGCLTPSAILAVLVTVILLGLVMLFGGSGLFSSGGLNAQVGTPLGGVVSHAQIGNDCARCHPAPWSGQTQGDRCMLCHTDITSQLADPKSLHSVLLKIKALPCFACHSDHQGPEASLTKMDDNAFPHAVTGYSLISHKKRTDGQDFTCADCHTKNLSRFDLQACSTCHQKTDSAFMSQHDLDYGSDCLACHDGVDTYTKKFDHSQAAFKLEGKHKGLVCEKCHANAKTSAEFKSLSPDCSNCHLKDDAHKGGFGTNCSACHKAAGWKPASFDHNLSAFRLEGEHVEVKCDRCHVNNVFKGTPSDCFACHAKEDEHAGTFGKDCAACHKSTGWEPATFNHDLSAFKLDGAHSKVACNDCHKNNVFKGTPTECAACHANPAYHAGMFSGQTCVECHTTGAWRPASYNGPHTFPMNHGEGNNACSDCHQPTLKEWTCYTCHDQSRTASKHREEGIANFDDCLRCHANGQEGGD